MRLLQNNQKPANFRNAEIQRGGGRRLDITRSQETSVDMNRGEEVTGNE